MGQKRSAGGEAAGGMGEFRRPRFRTNKSTLSFVMLKGPRLTAIYNSAIEVTADGQ